MAVSLSKAFGATGGALAFPTPELRDRVRRCGGPHDLLGPDSSGRARRGAGVGRAASRPEFEAMQAELRERMRRLRAPALRDAGTRARDRRRTPILMIHYDSAPGRAWPSIRALRSTRLLLPA